MPQKVSNHLEEDEFVPVSPFFATSWGRVLIRKVGVEKGGGAISWWWVEIVGCSCSKIPLTGWNQRLRVDLSQLHSNPIVKDSILKAFANASRPGSCPGWWVLFPCVCVGLFFYLAKNFKQLMSLLHFFVCGRDQCS